MWTEETIEKLIELYKQQPLLWDPKNKFYKNRHKKYEALKNISSAMNIEVVDIERKLNVLITQFRRTHKRVLNMKKSGMVVDDVEKNIWYGYKLLLFLEDRFDTTVLRKAAQQNQHEAQTTNQDSHHENTSNIPTTTILRGKYPQVSDNLQRIAGPINEAIVLMNNVPTKRPPGKDEYELYGEQIACKLRKMDEITRINTQHRINCIIHETEMKILNKKYGYSANSGLPHPSKSPPQRSLSPVSLVSFVETKEVPYEGKCTIRTTIKSDIAE